MASLGHRRTPWAFAVETNQIQVTWSSRPRGATRLVARGTDRAVDLPDGAGPGSALITDLPAATAIDLALEQADGSAVWSEPVRTLAPPPGPELVRFSTISDMHLGEERFGYRGTIAERPSPETPYSVRATAAAVAELGEWGAQLLVVKGDVTQSGQPDQWDRFAEAVTAFGRPVLAVAGNHDGIEDPASSPLVQSIEPSRRIPDHATALSPSEGLRRCGLASSPVQVRDEPGIRIVLVDTTIPHHRDGQIDEVADEVVTAAAEADRPVWIGLHHQLMTTALPTYLPVGIPKRASVRFLDRLAALGRPLFVSSGHTHRNRRRAHGAITITEVGSPKDYPGAWAGYVVHEGGIRQVVRRISRPDVLTWTDRSADAAFGLWGAWSPGTLDDRCFTRTWLTHS